MKCTKKKYKCSRCGFPRTQETNHYGKTYGIYWEGKKFGWCRVCPTEPYHKPPYDEYSPTVWVCIENPEIN